MGPRPVSHLRAVKVAFDETLYPLDPTLLSQIPLLYMALEHLESDDNVTKRPWVCSSRISLFITGNGEDN